MLETIKELVETLTKIKEACDNCNEVFVSPTNVSDWAKEAIEKASKKTYA